MEGFLFWLCGALMLLSGLMMVVSRSAVVSACWLIFAFINAAGIFAILSAPLLAILQVLVYAGAIMVLFLFVIMMLEQPVIGGERKLLPGWIWPFVALPPAAILIAIFGWWRTTGTASFGVAPDADFGSAQQVAGLLLNRYLLAFELISIVLLIAIIGALSLGKLDRRQPWK